MIKSLKNSISGRPLLRCSKTLLFLLMIGGAFIASTNLALGNEPTGYIPLEPIPGIEYNSEDETTVTEYIPGVVRLLIGIAGVLAVIKIMFGGILYMSTDAIGGKGEGKKHIEEALWGLLLIISAWIILFTLNPKLVKLNLSIEPLPIEGSFETDLGMAAWAPSGANIGMDWHDDQSVRNDLANVGTAADGGPLIRINKPNCQTIGQSNCTSVYNLHPSIKAKLSEMTNQCTGFIADKDRCIITISGATEYWLHGNRQTELDKNFTRHKPGGSAIDISKHSPLIASLNIPLASSQAQNRWGIERVGVDNGCINGLIGFKYKDVIFISEPTRSNEQTRAGAHNGVIDFAGMSHWHVCFPN